jgi:hypothetical protein
MSVRRSLHAQETEVGSAYLEAFWLVQLEEPEELCLCVELA